MNVSPDESKRTKQNSLKQEAIVEWIRYFVGTPQRLVRSAVGLAILAVIFSPGLLRTVVERLLNELAPLFGPLLTLAVVFVGIRIILFGRK